MVIKVITLVNTVMLIRVVLLSGLLKLLSFVGTDRDTRYIITDIMTLLLMKIINFTWVSRVSRVIRDIHICLLCAYYV